MGPSVTTTVTTVLEEDIYDHLVARHGFRREMLYDNAGVRTSLSDVVRLHDRIHEVLDDDDDVDLARIFETTGAFDHVHQDVDIGPKNSNRGWVVLTKGGNPVRGEAFNTHQKCVVWFPSEQDAQRWIDDHPKANGPYIILLREES